jgi:hypothetical protein
VTIGWHRSTGAKVTQQRVVPLAVRARHQQNDEEPIFDFSGPAMFTAIAEAAVRDDLLDRAIAINLPNVPTEHRRSEAEIEIEIEISGAWPAS